MTQTLNWSVRQACELEAQLVSVERLQSLSDLPPEPGYDIPSRGVDAHGWPKAEAPVGAAAAAMGEPRGRVELRGVSLRYRPGLPQVLHELSVSIEPGEKVGTSTCNRHVTVT